MDAIATNSNRRGDSPADLAAWEQAFVPLPAHRTEGGAAASIGHDCDSHRTLIGCHRQDRGQSDTLARQISTH